jgi:NADPH:quinone reductase-like Zn-dependent oxidoreductase
MKEDPELPVGPLTKATLGVSAVTGFNKGDVASLIPPTDIARWGTYGELANVPARNLVKHPENISLEVAAAS